MLAALLFVATPAAPPPKVLRFSPRPNRAAQIHWRAFGPEAFAEAKASHKPLFLNLAAIWCHWCHVFDETTLSDPAIIALLNAKFVPMRVDADQNPQIERRYLLGGWPTNAFLDEQGAVLGGGTYIPPARFQKLANAVVEGYGGDRAKLRAALGNVRTDFREAAEPGALSTELAPRVGQEIRRAVDAEHGGFGGAPKFPQGQAIALLAYLAQTRHDVGALADARRALGAMDGSELFDPVEGGFFRYAMRADWGSPHYEKMLATNAEILFALAETYAASHDEALRGPADSIVSYLVTHLWDEQAGALYASQDADEAYYKLDAEHRAARKAPPIDRTFLADRMGLAARALLRASTVFGEPDFLRYARRTEDFVLARMRSPGGGVFHALSATAGAKPSLPDNLGDLGQTSLALIDLASATGDSKYLRAAGEVLGAAQRQLADPGAPGYFDVPADPNAAGLLAERTKPFEENARLGWAMVRLGELNGDPALISRGKATLAAFAGAAHGLGAAEFARAADEAAGEGVRVVVVGAAKQGATQALLKAALAFDDPRREVRLLDSNARGAHLGELRFPAGPPAAYVCAGKLCSRPVRDPAKLDLELAKFVGAQLP